MNKELLAFREGVKWGAVLFARTNMETTELELDLGNGTRFLITQFEAEVDAGRQDGRYYTMKREQLLKEYGISESDVLEDEHGEYFLQDPSLMDDGDEPEDGRIRKVYIK